MRQILEEFNKTNSTNDKLNVMKKYKNNDEVKRMFQLALNKVRYTYGIKKYNAPTSHNNTISLTHAFDEIENKLVPRLVTGNAAIELVESLLQNLSEDDA